MRFDRDRLIFLALVVLDEVCANCQRGPVAPSFAVRLALATLHALGDAERAMFDDFWREMRDPKEGAYSVTQGNTLRGTSVRAHYTRIARSVGVELSIDYCERLAAVRPRRSVVSPSQQAN